MTDMSVEICGVRFKNPVIAASGTFGFGFEYEPFLKLSDLGGISVKGLTPAPREGNASPRIAEVSGGILNSVGLQNPGIDAFINDILPELKNKGTRIIANIAANTIEEYGLMAEKLRNQPVDMIELNISCPNVRQGGAQFGARPESVEQVTRAVKQHCAAPLMVKLTPNCMDIAENAAAAENGGADAISLINTLTGMKIDLKTRKPLLANITGGMSGPAVKPVALRMVYQAHKAVNIPIVGIGGIMTGEDAAEFMLCGASAVQVGTANLIEPRACLRIINELKLYCERNSIENVSALTGALNT